MAGRIYLVNGADGGRSAWYYFLVEPRKIPSFLAALNDNIIHLENYRQILKSGYGEAPPACVTQALEEFLRTEKQFPTGTQELFTQKFQDTWKAAEDILEEEEEEEATLAVSVSTGGGGGDRERLSQMDGHAEQILLDAIARSQLVPTAEELVRAGNWLSLADIADDLLLLARDLRSGLPEVAKAIFSWLGICYHTLGQQTKAIEHHEQCLSLAEEMGDRAGQGSTLGNLGNCYQRLGQYTKAIKLHEQHLAVAEEVGDRAGQGRAWGSLGICYQSLGQYTKAIEHHEQSLKIAEELGDRAMQGSVGGNLGISYSRLGQYTKAIEHLEQSL
jgi:tetratricopeptide (TPR) repeat protein